MYFCQIGSGGFMRKKAVFLSIIMLLSLYFYFRKDNNQYDFSMASQLNTQNNQSEAVQFSGQNIEPYTFLIGTDLHFLSQSLTDNGEYFTRIIKNGDGKVMLYIDDLVNEFFNQVIVQKPDALLLTGDLTFNGELFSHQEMAQKLKTVEDAGIDVFVLPGNHDINTECYSFEGNGYFETKTTNSEQFYKLYADFGYNQAIATDENSASYIVELLPYFWLIMLDTSSQSYNALTPETMNFLEEKLLYAQENNIRVVTGSHQNLISHNKMFEFGFLINNSVDVVSLFKKYNVLCNFSGHIHIQHIAKENDFYDIATGALSVCENNYGELIINENSLSYSVKNIESFSKQSKDFFYETALKKRMDGQNDIELTKTVASINTEYFAGKLNQMPKDVLENIDNYTQSSSFSKYFSSLADEAKRNFNNLELAIFY